MGKNYQLENWQYGDLPVVPLQDKGLNMYLKYGVDMFGVMGCALPYGSLKLPAAVALMDALLTSGVFRKGDILVEATSGRMGQALVHVARSEPYEASDVILVMKTDVPKAKSAMPVISGATVMSPIPDPQDPRKTLTPIQTARHYGGGGWDGNTWKYLSTADGKRIINPDQYACEFISQLYCDVIVPKILKATSGDLQIIVVPLGTGGTVRGIKEGCIKYGKEEVVVVAVSCAKGNEIPGMRDEDGLLDVNPVWKKNVDHLEKVKRTPAFLCAPQLDWDTGYSVGPSGSAAYVGGCQLTKQLILAGELPKNKMGKTNVLFVVHDDAVLYAVDRFMTEFSMGHFHASTALSPEQIIFGE